MIDMATTIRNPKTLEDYLALAYPFNVIADPDGGFTAVFPDLPGCITQADTLAEVAVAAEDARRLWITVEFQDGAHIPLPSYPEEFSGKFNLRLPKSLHRSLSEAADRDGVSLNQYAVTLLSTGNTLARLERRFEEMAVRVDALADAVVYRVEGTPGTVPHRSSAAGTRLLPASGGVRWRQRLPANKPPFRPATTPPSSEVSNWRRSG
jgi:antitoxin HicB